MTYSWKYRVSPPREHTQVTDGFNLNYVDYTQLYHETSCSCPEAGTAPRSPLGEAYFSIVPRLNEQDFAAMFYFMENASSAKNESLASRNIEGTECPWRPSNTWSNGGDVGHWRSVLVPMSQENPWYMIEHTRTYGWQQWLRHLLNVLVPLNYVITGAMEWRDVDDPENHGLVYLRAFQSHSSVTSVRFASPQISWQRCEAQDSISR